MWYKKDKTNYKIWVHCENCREGHTNTFHINSDYSVLMPIGKLVADILPSILCKTCGNKTLKQVSK